MVKTEKKEFQMHEEDVKKLIKELNSHNIYPELNGTGLKFMIQSNDNVVYDIQINVIERFELDEQVFMLNVYPNVKTFEDVQLKLFGKVQWK